MSRKKFGKYYILFFIKFYHQLLCYFIGFIVEVQNENIGEGKSVIYLLYRKTY